jgi:K+-sensing histidine kinase KdpD
MAGVREDRAAPGDPLLAAFIAALDHDLRTPLQNLRMAVTLLSSESAGVPERLLAPLVRTVDRLEALMLAQMAALRDLVREPVLAPARVDALVGAALSLVRSERAPAVAPRIDEVAAVRVDEALLADALAIVLEHALARTSGGGEAVELRARAEGNAILVAVSDDGPALDADARACLFEPVGRNTRALALAVARRIVARAGGRLDVHDDREHALTLTFELPRAP